MVTKLNASRGRPRGFDPDAAIAVGQRMFHAQGYDAVGLAALTEALGIKPPSFYKAFTSKAAYFAQILDHYAKSVLTLDEVLVCGRAPELALTELLDRAARTYVQDPACLGCLVLETARGHIDNESTVLARHVAEKRRATIQAFIAATHPDKAQEVTDFVACAMSGLSACAREGFSEARLIKIAAAASPGLNALLYSD